MGKIALYLFLSVRKSTKARKSKTFTFTVRKSKTFTVRKSKTFTVKKATKVRNVTRCVFYGKLHGRFHPDLACEEVDKGEGGVEVYVFTYFTYFTENCAADFNPKRKPPYCIFCCLAKEIDFIGSISYTVVFNFFGQGLFP